MKSVHLESVYHSIGLECERAALIFTQKFKSAKCFSNPEQFLSKLCFREANIPALKKKKKVKYV